MMKFTFRHTLSALLIAAAPLQAQTVDATIDRAVAAWAKVRTVRGTFQQSISNSLTGGSAIARGEFQQERPSKLSIRFTEPAGDVIIADGKAVWLFLPSASPGQVIKRPATDRSALPIDFSSQFLESPRTKYDIADGGTATVGTRATHILKLTPKKGTRSPFNRATVWVDDDDALIRQFEVSDDNGITRRIRLETLNVNIAVEAGAFTFKVPKGVKVVEEPM